MHTASNSPLGPNGGGLADWEQTLAQFIVGDFVDERGLLPGLDRADLVQELLIHWLQQRDKYSQSRGASIETFFRKVARNRLEDIYETQKAAKRGGRMPLVSLNRPIVNEEGVDGELGDFVADPKDMASEVAGEVEGDRILRLLTSRQKELAEGLAQGYKIADMARKMKVPRTTLKDELARIRRNLRKNGYGSR